MRFKRLKVKNIRSYSDLEIDFNEGVTVVSGVNGSGKSSLLEACFVGLFGHRGIPKDFVLADLVRKGCEEAAIHLEFEHKGQEYAAIQEFRNNPETGKASTTRSYLEIDGEVVVNQATQTYESIRNLLRMDEEAYKNCVYIRQGDIDVLINARKKDRQRMIDDLLQIGRLEEYRERAKSARTGVGRHITETHARIKDQQEEIEAIDATKPVARKNQLNTDLKQLQQEVANLETMRDRTSTRIEKDRQHIEQYTRTQKQIDELDRGINGLEKRKKEALTSLESKRKEGDRLHKSILGIENKIQELYDFFGLDETTDVDNFTARTEKEERDAYEKISQIKNKQGLKLQERENSQKGLTETKQNLNALEEAIKKRSTQEKDRLKEIEKINQEYSVLEDEIGKLLENAQSMGFDQGKLDNLEELEDLLLNKQRHLHGKEKEVRTRLDQISKTLTEHRNLLEKGACPTCGQDLQGSTIGNDTKEEELQRKELEEQLGKLIQDTQRAEEKITTLKEAGKIKKQVDEKRQKQLLINQKQENLVSYNEELKKQNQEDEKKKQELSERIGELEKDIKRTKDEIKEIQQTAKTATEHHNKIKEKLESAKYLIKIRHDHTQMQSDHQHLKTGIADIQENMRFIDEQIAEKKRNKKQLENELGKENIEKLEKKLQEFQQAYQKIIGDIEEKNKQKTGLLKEIGQIETNLKRKKALQEKLKVFNNREKYLKAVKSDVESLEDMYMRLRADLRTRNIDALDRLLNEIFSFMYTNNAYSHIQLDTDYDLTIYEKDGTPLEPKLLSGGERAIFNLVLRCAIYRLLSEGLAGGEYRNEMPPLIMDEPTVFLDRGHVHQLLKLIDLMRDMGVGQILIVSHDETLIDSADNVFEVQKDPTTNISSIIAQ